MDMCRRRFYYFFLFFCGIVIQAAAGEPFIKLASWRESWKFDVKTGIGTILNEVPAMYLDQINEVNVPVLKPGPSGVFSFRKAVSAHFEMGYQLSYFAVGGNVDQDERTFKVRSKVLEHNYLFLYNLKRTDHYRPMLNYFVYYKIGSIALKNEPRLRLPDGSYGLIYGTSPNEPYVPNVAVGLGLGLGINYQLSYNLALVGTVELNRSADKPFEIYKIQNMFSQSEHTVNNFSILSFGLSYAIDFPGKKQDLFDKVEAETEKRLKKSSIQRKKRQSQKNIGKFWPK